MTRNEFLKLAPTPALLALLVFAAYTVLVLVRLEQRNWDASTFIVAGDRYVNRTQLIAPIAVIPNSSGYDGQFYYRLALNPFATEVTQYGITLDVPAYRVKRIGFPFLAWAVSSGHARELPWVMIGLNLVGLGAIAYVSTKLTRRHNAPVYLGLLPCLYPGFFLTLLRDTTEVVAAAFACAAMYLALNRSFWKAIPFATAAALTRETTILYLFGFGVTALIRMFRERKWSWDIVAIAIPAIIFLGWQYLVFRTWGASPFSGTEPNLGMPFVGIWSFFNTNSLGPLQHTFEFKLHAYFLGAAVICGLIGLIVAGEAIRGAPPPPITISWAICALLVICLTTSVWVEPYAYLRAFSDCYVVGTILLILSRHLSGARYALAVVGLMWAPTFWYGSVA